MTLDDLKGRTYVARADFWRDLERVIDDVRCETIRKCAAAARIRRSSTTAMTANTCEAAAKRIEALLEPEESGL